MRAIRKRMVELDFKEEFIEKILKEYSVKKIDEKLDLLMERKNIKSSIGWLRAALKNDYRDEEQERYDEKPTEESRELNSQIPSLLGGEDQGGGKKILSSEEAIKAIKLIQDNLSACISPVPSGKRTRAREGLL